MEIVVCTSYNILFSRFKVFSALLKRKGQKEERYLDFSQNLYNNTYNNKYVSHHSGNVGKSKCWNSVNESQIYLLLSVIL